MQSFLIAHIDMDSGGMAPDKLQNVAMAFRDYWTSERLCMPISDRSLEQ